VLQIQLLEKGVESVDEARSPSAHRVPASLRNQVRDAILRAAQSRLYCETCWGGFAVADVLASIFSRVTKKDCFSFGFVFSVLFFYFHFSRVIRRIMNTALSALERSLYPTLRRLTDLPTSILGRPAVFLPLQKASTSS